MELKHFPGFQGFSLRFVTDGLRHRISGNSQSSICAAVRVAGGGEGGHGPCFCFSFFSMVYGSENMYFTCGTEKIRPFHEVTTESYLKMSTGLYFVGQGAWARVLTVYGDHVP